MSKPPGIEVKCKCGWSGDLSSCEHQAGMSACLFACPSCRENLAIMGMIDEDQPKSCPAGCTDRFSSQKRTASQLVGMFRRMSARSPDVLYRDSGSVKVSFHDAYGVFSAEISPDLEVTSCDLSLTELFERAASASEG